MLLGAVEAIIGGVVALNDVPVSIEWVVVEGKSSVGGIAAGSVVVGVGRREREALVVDDEALHHGVVVGGDVTLRAGEGASGVHPAAGGAHKVVSADIVSKAALDLVSAVSLGAGSVLDRKAVVSELEVAVQPGGKKLGILSGCLGVGDDAVDDVGDGIDIVFVVIDIGNNFILDLIDDIGDIVSDDVRPGTGLSDSGYEERNNYEVQFHFEVKIIIIATAFEFQDVYYGRV